MLNKAIKIYSNFRVNKLNSLDIIQTQENILLNLLKRNQFTNFGKDHNFNKLKDISAFQKNVPIRTYENFWDIYLKSSFPQTQNILSVEQAKFLSVSSGTTSGKTKYIPYTQSLRNSNAKAGIDLIAWHYHNFENSKLFSGKNFFLGGSTDLVKEAENIYSGDLSGIAVKTLPMLIKPFYYPNSKLALIKNWEEKIDTLARDSIKQNITLLAGVPSWLLIFFDKLFEITGEDNLSKIYPNLETLVHGGVSFTPYFDRFKKILGNKVKLREVYPASEGFIAIGDRDYGEGLRLNCDHGIFFEFIPLEELNSANPTRHWIKNVELNQNYAVVMTTPGGLYSYLIGDTVKFIDKNPARILITGRTSYMLSAFGEHVIANEIESSIDFACKKLNLSVTDYSVGAKFPDENSKLGKHIYVIEFETKDNFDQNTFISLVDQHLKSLNDDYEAHRAEGYGMDAPEIKVVASGFFTSWMKSRGKLGGQNKVPRIITDEKLFQNLINYKF